MTEHEQLQQLLTAIGVPHTATTQAYPIAQPAQRISIAEVELWFNSRGQFLQVCQDTYDDSIEEPRTYTPGFVLEEDAVVSRNAIIAEQEYEEKQQRRRAAQAEHDHKGAVRMAIYRLDHPLPLPGHAREALDSQARKLLDAGMAAAIEQAIDQIAQQDVELFQLVLDEEVEARGSMLIITQCN